jgi:hypothetical protein
MRGWTPSDWKEETMSDEQRRPYEFDITVNRLQFDLIRYLAEDAIGMGLLEDLLGREPNEYERHSIRELAELEEP